MEEEYQSEDPSRPNFRFPTLKDKYAAETIDGKEPSLSFHKYTRIMTSFQHADAPCDSGRMDNDLGVYIPPQPLSVLRQPQLRKHYHWETHQQEILFLTDSGSKDSPHFEGGDGEYDEGSFYQESPSQPDLGDSSFNDFSNQDEQEKLMNAMPKKKQKLESKLSMIQEEAETPHGQRGRRKSSAYTAHKATQRIAEDNDINMVTDDDKEKNELFYKKLRSQAVDDKGEPIKVSGTFSQSINSEVIKNQVAEANNMKVVRPPVQGLMMPEDEKRKSQRRGSQMVNNMSPRASNPRLSLGDQVQTTMDQVVRKKFHKKFLKEVDFHHKMAFRFEKAYRLSKQHPEKRDLLRNEIIEGFDEYSEYIEHDPMSLFYCLFFCIYYDNQDIVEFLRVLIGKLEEDRKPQMIETLLAFIETNGIERLRARGEKVNTHVYHLVLYQAIDDKLKVVYNQLIHVMKFIQLRDKDAVFFLKMKDYSLIEKTFEKFPTRLTGLQQYFSEQFALKSNKYRVYSEAYYEEIIIEYQVDRRIALYFRDRFLNSEKEIKKVLEMYCKNDFVDHFLKIKFPIKHSDYFELFAICLRNGSFKIALQIYLRYLKQSDIDKPIIDILIQSLKQSVLFLEMKLFFIHQHFDLLDIVQLNELVDAILIILFREDPKMNPILSQFNTVKVSLLIFRVTWRIHQKKIYPLTTKCSTIEKYLIKSMDSYLERNHHISQLYKLMTEPILHLTDHKDSLDIMLEMKMEHLLKHPVIVEVLNLTYEGKYSSDSDVLSLTATLASFFYVETLDSKSFVERFLQNMKSLVGRQKGGQKQSTFIFDIWKQSIKQRQENETFMTILYSLILLFYLLRLDLGLSSLIQDTQHPEYDFIDYMKSLNDEDARSFCMDFTSRVSSFLQLMGNIQFLVGLQALGYLTAFVQKITISRVKENASIPTTEAFLDVSLFAFGALYLGFTNFTGGRSPLSTKCFYFMDPDSYTDSVRSDIDYVYELINHSAGDNHYFQILVSVQCILLSFQLVHMLQRTESVGDTILLLISMVNEMKKFIFTFGMPIITLLLILRYQFKQFKTLKEEDYPEESIWQTFLDLFNGLTASQDFSEYKTAGQIFVSSYAYIFFFLLISFLVAIFVNRYSAIYSNIEAVRRMDIIKLKNSKNYDPLIGAVTMTFFPINILLLPFILPVIGFKSPRVSDLFLKVQYGLMIALYCLLGLIIAVPICPLLFCKAAINISYLEVTTAMHEKGNRWKVWFLHCFGLLIKVAALPLLILTSLLIDFLKLTTSLLQDEKYFEYKYLDSLEQMDPPQTKQVTATFIKAFYKEYQTFKGIQMTFERSMNQHRKTMRIVDNMHDLTCRGNKDYKKALENVKDFNLAKVLVHKCTIPHSTGDIKKGWYNIDVIYAIQTDIELFNYVDILFAEFKQGKLSSTDNQIEGRILNGKRKIFKLDEEIPKGALRLHPAAKFTPMSAAPPGKILYRNNQDYMNNFFINIVTRSYTDIEKTIKELDFQSQQKKVKAALQQLSSVRETWKQQFFNTLKSQYDNMDRTAMAIAQQTQPGGNKAVANFAFNKLINNLRDPMNINHLVGVDTTTNRSRVSDFELLQALKKLVKK